MITAEDGRSLSREEKLSLLQTLWNELLPEPGSTPDAVNVSGVWAAAEAKARLEWPPSDDAALDHYEVRGVPGAEYSGDDGSVLATIAKGDPLVWLGDDFLTQPGAVASFKVFVVLPMATRRVASR